MATINTTQHAAVNLNGLFNQLLRYRDSQAARDNPQRLGPWLQQQLKVGIFPPLSHLPFESGGYTRNYIAKEQLDRVASRIHNPTGERPIFESSRFEALIMRWDKHSKTSIHGHPSFSFYYVISGIFKVEHFERTALGQLHTKEIQRLAPTDATWSLGRAHRYDNSIHRVTCLIPGLTFHVYSDDALKGNVFD